MQADLLRIVESGGAIRISGHSMRHAHIVGLVNAARLGGGAVWVTGADAMMRPDLLALAQAGRGGHVVLDYTVG